VPPKPVVRQNQEYSGTAANDTPIITATKPPHANATRRSRRLARCLLRLLVGSAVIRFMARLLHRAGQRTGAELHDRYQENHDDEGAERQGSRWSARRARCCCCSVSRMPVSPRSPASGGELCAGLSSFITALIVMP
jgi:hypothetical protein